MMVSHKRELTLDEITAEERALTDFQFAIIDAMNARGVSQSDLATMLGVTRARVSQLLSPEANPTIKLVGRALNVLGVKAEYSRSDRRETESKSADDYWQVFVAKIEAHQVHRHKYATAQVDIFKSRATMRKSLWSHHANDDYSAPVVRSASCVGVA